MQITNNYSVLVAVRYAGQ